MLKILRLTFGSFQALVISKCTECYNDEFLKVNKCEAMHGHCSVSKI